MPYPRWISMRALRLRIVFGGLTSFACLLLLAGSTSSTSSMPSFTTNYSSALTSSSASFTRPGGSGSFFYESLEWNNAIGGFYNVTSSSSMSTYGYLYVYQFDSSNLNTNLIASDGGTGQFLISFTLQAGVRYILIFTTYYSSIKGVFLVSVSGPSRTSVFPTNVVSSSTPRSSTTGLVMGECRFYDWINFACPL